LAPIELLFNGLRTAVDRTDPRTEADLRDAIAKYLATVKASDVKKLYKHAWKGVT